MPCATGSFIAIEFPADLAAEAKLGPRRGAGRRRSRSSCCPGRPPTRDSPDRCRICADEAAAPTTKDRNHRDSWPSSWVNLHSSFSNPRKPLGSLISRVLRGSRTRRPRSRSTQIADERGSRAGEFASASNLLSVPNRAELIAKYAEGMPVRELAARFNVHRGTVREIARQAGLAARRPELPDAIRQVAARLAVSTEAVRSAVIASGGTIRAGGHRRAGA